MVSQYGRGALIAKFDVEAAYQNVPVHPCDRFLLGMKWPGQYYTDLALPFGLRSVPYIFNSVADMVEWILLNSHHVSDLLHYLDDFITASPSNLDQCASNLHTAVEVCSQLGLSLHPNKCVGPTTVLVVLGIELDSVAPSVWLPAETLQALQSLILRWQSHKWCNRQELESLIGHLQHAAKVVWPGRTFLRRMIDLLCCFRRRDHPIRLNAEFHLDLPLSPIRRLFPLSWSINLSPHLRRLVSWLLGSRLSPIDTQMLRISSEEILQLLPSPRHTSRNSLPCPADEWTLCLFATFLAESVQASSIFCLLCGHCMSIRAIRTLY